MFGSMEQERNFWSRFQLFPSSRTLDEPNVATEFWVTLRLLKCKVLEPAEHQRYLLPKHHEAIRMAKDITSDAPKSHQDLGQWITRCGPKSKASTFGLVILFGFMLSGLGCLIAGITVTPQPGSEGARPVFIGIGIAMIAIAVLCLLFMALWKNPQVDLYSNGIRFMAKGTEQFIHWAQMDKVKVTTIYDTRFSHYRTVMISAAGQEDIQFESKLEGQPDQIIDSILQSAPNVELAEVDMGA
jgi:hypothetical protein